MSSIEQTLKSRKSLLPKLAFQGFLVGIVVGLIIVLFRLCLEEIHHLILHYWQEAAKGWAFLLTLFIFYLLFGFISGLLVRHEPMISGSGIPQVSGLIAGHFQMKWYRVLCGKILGGLLSLGAGLTLGREGPSVQMGACCGEAVATVLKRPPTEHKYLISAGAASGVAAAFSAPLSGVAFALEEIHRNFSPLALVSAMSGAITADYISKTVFGLHPELTLPLLPRLPLRYYVLVILLGIFVGLSGALFNHTIMLFKGFYGKLPLPVWVKTTLPFAITFVILAWDLRFFGAGQSFIETLQESSIPLLIGIYILKLFLLALAFGSGLPGGIFFPLLVLGSLVGEVFGLFFNQIGLLPGEYILYFTVIAMAAHFTAIVRAPITGILLILELTGSFSFVLPLSLVSLFAYFTVETMHIEPIYESLLHVLLHSDKNQDECASAKEHRASQLKLQQSRVLLEFALSHESVLSQQKIKDINWPDNMLIVAVKRGHQELLPTPDTKLQGGDFIVILTALNWKKTIIREMDVLL